jgi:hypothetical protein
MKSVVAFQSAITSTGTAQNLPNNPILRSVTISTPATNSAVISIGNASSVTSTTGYILAAGSSVVIELPGGNTHQFWVVGTSGDVLSVVGI